MPPTPITLTAAASFLGQNLKCDIPLLCLCSSCSRRWSFHSGNASVSYPQSFAPRLCLVIFCSTTSQDSCRGKEIFFFFLEAPFVKLCRKPPPALCLASDAPVSSVKFPSGGASVFAGVCYPGAQLPGASPTADPQTSLPPPEPTPAAAR